MVTGTPLAELLFSPADNMPISTEESTIKPWAQARAALATAAKYWLTTVRPDGRPHVAPVLGVLLDDAIHVSTRPGTRKARNLEADPRCALAIATDIIDLVVETEASDVRDPETLLAVVAAFERKYGWSLSLRDGVLREDGLPGSPVNAIHRLAPRVAFGYGPEGLTATRWRF